MRFIAKRAEDLGLSAELAGREQGIILSEFRFRVESQTHHSSSPDSSSLVLGRGLGSWMILTLRLVQR